MNILIVHNRYREPGGEDRVVDLESALLSRHGHRVVHYVEDNARIERMAAPVLALRTIWSFEGYAQVRALIRQERIDVLHVHNTLPLASPAVYYAARAAGVPVVQTLHNYRLLCPNALCFRGDSPCVECVTRRAAIPALRHACYRGSYTATATIATMLWVHKTAGTWQRSVDAFIAPSAFARSLFVGSGLAADRISVKPHFVDPDPGVGLAAAVMPCSSDGFRRRRASTSFSKHGANTGTDTAARRWGRTICAPGRRGRTDIPGLRWLGRNRHRKCSDSCRRVLPGLPVAGVRNVRSDHRGSVRRRHAGHRFITGSRS